MCSRPDAATAAELNALDGDIMVLGVSGKVGPSLARMAARAAPDKRVIGVARFSDPAARDQLDDWGIEISECFRVTPTGGEPLAHFRRELIVK